MDASGVIVEVPGEGAGAGAGAGGHTTPSSLRVFCGTWNVGGCRVLRVAAAAVVLCRDHPLVTSPHAQLPPWRRVSRQETHSHPTICRRGFREGATALTSSWCVAMPPR
jgi:hypothetical protein